MSTVFSKSFWTAVKETTWEREPALWKGVVAGSLGTEADLYAGLLNRVSDAARYGFLPPMKFYRGQSAAALDVPSPEARPFEPRAEDRTLRGYLDRLVTQTEGQDLGFIVNHVHAFHPAIWRRTAALLDAALEVLPMPSGGMLSSSFFGTYRKTQVGIHKDAQNVFVLPIEGAKRFRFWSEAALANHPAVQAMGDAARANKARIPNLDPSEVLDLSITLDVGPSDLLYIPKGFWHIAEPLAPVASSFHIGFFSHEPAAPKLAKFFTPNGSAGPRDAAPPLPPPTDDPTRELARWRSGLGLLALRPQVPDRCDPARPAACVAPRSVTIERSGEDLALHVAGHRVSVAGASAELTRAVEEALSGRPFTRTALLTSVAEPAAQEKLASLLDRLESIGGVLEVDDGEGGA